MAKRQTVQREKVEQAHIVQLLRALGAEVYVLGTRRRRGDFQGTMQTPGVPDVMAFLKASDRDALSPARVMLFVECKAPGGRLRPEQARFRELALDADVRHVVGGYDDVIDWLVRTGHARAEQFPHYRRQAPQSFFARQSPR